MIGSPRVSTVPLAFTALDTLVGVKATNAGRLLDRLDRLGVHHGGARVGILAHASTFGLMQSPPEVRPEARATELPEVIVHGLPRRKIAQQVAPGTTRAQQIKERVEDDTEAVAAEPPVR